MLRSYLRVSTFFKLNSPKIYTPVFNVKTPFTLDHIQALLFYLAWCQYKQTQTLTKQWDFAGSIKTAVPTANIYPEQNSKINA